MKAIIAILLSASTCMSPPDRIKESPVKERIIDHNYSVIMIDYCEYIKYKSGSGYSYSLILIHKGNCPNHSFQ